MQGEVKITVVATGFDDDMYNVATGGRRRMEPVGRAVAKSTDGQDMATEEDDNKSEIDVPAFIRKKIKN